MSHPYPSPSTPTAPYENPCPIPPQATGTGMRSPAHEVNSTANPAGLHQDLSKGGSPSNPALATAEKPRRAAPANMGATGRRGKLDYHRAPTACTHCRKRKIRCKREKGTVPCEACLKLNKSCVFLPVDHTRSQDRTITRQSLLAHRAAASQRVPMAIPPIQNMSLPESPGLKVPPGAPINRPYAEYGSGAMAGSWQPYSQHPPLVSSLSPYSRATPPPGGWHGPHIPADTSAARVQMQWSAYPAPDNSFTAMSQMTADAYGRKTSPLSPSELYPSLPTMSSPHLSHATSLSSLENSNQATRYGSWQQPQTYTPPAMTRPGDSYGAWYPDGEGVAAGSQPRASGNAGQQDWNWIEATTRGVKMDQGDTRSQHRGSANAHQQDWNWIGAANRGVKPAQNDIRE